ncbi:MAG: HlyD family efflux transporter periplasmic adaptor subunit [Flavobacteriales bacterium]|jgi:HlyD family secretion protein|nr:HlyD family efflux transporter periplasmic adaptor subunit [Flavobacteriales bacterium]
MKKHSRWLILIAVVALAAWFLWDRFQSPGLGAGFASGNGRIEAIETDVATKLAGRIEEILVKEGDFIERGQVLARMNVDVLKAQLAQAKAQVAQAQNAQRTAVANVSLRESEKATAKSVVAQREAEKILAEKRFVRTEALREKNVVTQEELDEDRASVLSSQAALAASQSQVLSADAAIAAAKSQVIEAESAVAAAMAEVARIEADIEDSELESPRGGRVQYKIAEVGEVLPAGGAVLNVVDLSDVYMTFFLPTLEAGQVSIGHEVRLVLDALPQFVIPAKVTFVDSVAQFTPKMVETESEREKLMFRVKAHIPPDLLREHLTKVKTGLPGMAYLRLDDQAVWPERLEINVPQ